MNLKTIVDITNDNNYYFHTDKKFIDFINNTNTRETVKPQGLWFSIGNDFFRWELNEGTLINGTKYLYKINLKNHYTTELYNPINKPVLILYPKMIEDFLDEYRYYQDKENNSFLYDFVLDNKKIKKNYSGILFKDYRKNHNSKTNFYNTIDASSGVIWDKRVLVSIKEIYIRTI